MPFPVRLAKSKLFRAFVVLCFIGAVLVEAWLSYQVADNIVAGLGVGVMLLIAMKYVCFFISSAFRNILIDALYFKRIDKYLSNFVAAHDRPIRPTSTANQISNMQLEAVNSRAYFAVPLSMLLQDMILVTSLILIFFSHLEFKKEMFLVAATGAPLIAIFYLLSDWAGKMWSKKTALFNASLHENFQGTYFNSDNTAYLNTLRPNQDLRMATATVATVSQAGFSIMIAIPAAAVYLGSIFFQVPNVLPDINVMAYDVVFMVFLLQPAQRIIKGSNKIFVGRAALRKFVSLSSIPSHVDGWSLVELRHSAEDNTIELDVDREKYVELFGVQPPPRLVLVATKIVKLSGGNGSGKSTYLWTLFRALQSRYRCTYFPQSISHDAAVGEMGRSGGETTLSAVSHVLSSDREILLLDEPANNLDRQAIASLNRQLQEFQGMVLLVDHTNCVYFDYDVSLD